MFRFSSDVYLYQFMGFTTLLLLQIIIYSIKMLHNLNRQYVDVQDAFDVLNKLTLFKAYFHLFLTYILYGNHHDYLFLFNVPVLAMIWDDLDAFAIPNPARIRRQLIRNTEYAIFFLVSIIIYAYLWFEMMYIPRVVTVRLTQSA